MAGRPSPASPLGPLPRASGRNSHSTGGTESGSGQEWCLSNKTRPQPEQHQAFKPNPPELAFWISLSSLLSGNRSHTRPDFALCTPKGANPWGPSDEPRLSQMWKRSPGLIKDLSQLTGHMEVRAGWAQRPGLLTPRGFPLQPLWVSGLGPRTSRYSRPGRDARSTPGSSSLPRWPRPG